MKLAILAFLYCGEFVKNPIVNVLTLSFLVPFTGNDRFFRPPHHLHGHYLQCHFVHRHLNNA